MCVFLGVSDQSKAYKLYNSNIKKIIFSWDVIFDEENLWAWTDRTSQQQILVDFDNEDDEKNPEALENEQQHGICPMTVPNEPLEHSDAAHKARPRRSRKKPIWMDDYEVSGCEEYDTLTYFALFADGDPINFEVAVKESKWQKAVADEIATIERNNT